MILNFFELYYSSFPPSNLIQVFFTPFLVILYYVLSFYSQSKLYIILYYIIYMYIKRILYKIYFKQTDVEKIPRGP